jgi:serine protease Do
MRMTNTRLAALFGALLGTMLAGAAAPARAHEPMPNIAEIVPPLLPGVVNISVWGPSDAETPRDAMGRKPNRAHFFGSGFVIDPSGVIVTNKHVVNNAFQITVHFSDGTRARARLLAVGGAVDIALLKVNVPHPLHALAWGNSDDLKIGDPVLAIGNPLGLGMSVSAGIVSALNRNINDSPYDDYIQTDAAINHGNSGGPLVDLEGEVVGIDTSLFTVPNGGSIGLGFAITANDAKFVVDRLLQYGEVRAGWIGVALQDVGADVVASFGLPWNRGAIVANVDAESPAGKAGIREGDIIRAVDGRAISDARALMRSIGKTAIGTRATLQVWRQGNELTIPVEVGSYPSDGASEKMQNRAVAMRLDLPDFGMTLQPLTPAARTKFQISASQAGLLVGAVAFNSVAAQHGLAGGDVIVRVQDAPVTTHAEFENAIRQAEERGRRYVEMLVRSGSDQRWIGFALKGADVVD